MKVRLTSLGVGSAVTFYKSYGPHITKGTQCDHAIEGRNKQQDDTESSMENSNTCIRYFENHLASTSGMFGSLRVHSDLVLHAGLIYLQDGDSLC